MLINAGNIEKSFGDRLLFRGVSFNVEPGDKIGLIGENGCGKTTLFNMITGKEPCDAGGIVRKSGITVGVLAQHACMGSVRSAYDEALTVFSDLFAIETELKAVDNRLLSSSDDQLIEKQHLLREKFEREGGLTFRQRTRSALLGLGFSDEEQRLSVASLSGGQRSKVELCKLLLSQPEVMLLDEPTNHLDIDSIEWLDGYIKQSKSAVIIISHDRYFLDRVANRIFEIAEHTLFCCDGNYTKYCRVRDERLEAERNSYENTMKEVERLERVIEQQRRWNREKSIKRAESKQKVVDRLLETLKIPEAEKKDMCLSFSALSRSGDEVLKAENLCKRFVGKTLYSDVSVNIRRGDRIFIIGPNGCGKTTLLKQLSDRGQVTFGVGVKAGFFDQHQSDLDLKNTVFGELRNTFPAVGDSALRGALALFLFKGDEVFKSIETLSGGERARVALCKLMLRHDNLLFLDEPTNHLDIESREVLEEALLDFDGTLVCVSHDRYLINRLATVILYFENGTLKRQQGNYDDYLAARDTGVKKSTGGEKAESDNKRDYLQRKQAAAEERKRKADLARCEEQIAAAEKEQKEIKKELDSDRVSTDYEKLTELTRRAAELDELLLSLMEKWETLSQASSV